MEVEVPFETLIAGRPVRGRIDAVFGDAPEGGFDVVDWKTGHPPGEAERQAVAVQLAAYRLAWSQLAAVCPRTRSGPRSTTSGTTSRYGRLICSTTPAWPR